MGVFGKVKALFCLKIDLNRVFSLFGLGEIGAWDLTL